MDWILGGVDNALGRVINTYRTTYFFRVKLTLSLAAIKKSIEWRLQVQIAFLTEVNLAPSRPE
jgi:hypothetical protein